MTAMASVWRVDSWRMSSLTIARPKHCACTGAMIVSHGSLQSFFQGYMLYTQ